MRTVHELSKLDVIGAVAGLELGQSSGLPCLISDPFPPLAREQRTAALVEARESEYGAQVSLTGDLGDDDVERESGEGTQRALFKRARDAVSDALWEQLQGYRLTLIFLLGAGLSFAFILDGFWTSARARKAHELVSRRGGPGAVAHKLPALPRPRGGRVYQTRIQRACACLESAS